MEKSKFTDGQLAVKVAGLALILLGTFLVFSKVEVKKTVQVNKVLGGIAIIGLFLVIYVEYKKCKVEPVVKKVKSKKQDGN